MTSPHPARPSRSNPGKDDIVHDEAEAHQVLSPEEMVNVSVEEIVGTHCEVDGKVIEMMAFKMTGVCSEYCRKVRDKEITDARPVRLVE